MLSTHMRDTLERRIIAKAWESSAYKDALMRDPKAVILTEMRDTFGDEHVNAETWDITVHEENARSFHLVLPANPDEQPDILDVLDVSPTAEKACNTGGDRDTRCGTCSLPKSR